MSVQLATVGRLRLLKASVGLNGELRTVSRKWPWPVTALSGGISKFPSKNPITTKYEATKHVGGELYGCERKRFHWACVFYYIALEGRVNGRDLEGSDRGIVDILSGHFP